MKNKKGVEMIIGVIIVIVLSLIVLAVVIYGFTTGWNNLWENIKNFGGGSSNIGTVVKACQVYCTSQSIAEYCTKTNVKFANSEGKIVTNNNMTCQDLAKGGLVLDIKKPSLNGTLPPTGLECDLDCSSGNAPLPIS